MQSIIRDIKKKITYLRNSPRNEPIYLGTGYNSITGQPVDINKVPTPRRFDLGPRLSESEIIAFEDQNEIRLPDEYRQFLLQVGNGGAGPWDNLIPLDRTIQKGPWGFRNPPYSFVTQQDLAKPFPCTTRQLVYDWMQQQLGLEASDWKVLDKMYATKNDLDRADKRYQVMDSWWDYFNELDATRGVLVVSAHLGDTYFDLLVVTGLERGNMWAEDEVMASLYPYPHPDVASLMGKDLFTSHIMDLVWNTTSESSRCDFLTWYNAWLDAELRLLEQNLNHTFIR